jgi:hypothetical protein
MFAFPSFVHFRKNTFSFFNNNYKSLLFPSRCNIPSLFFPVATFIYILFHVSAKVLPLESREIASNCSTCQKKFISFTSNTITRNIFKLSFCSRVCSGGKKQISGAIYFYTNRIQLEKMLKDDVKILLHFHMNAFMNKAQD